jgi:hypothetical protein
MVTLGMALERAARWFDPPGCRHAIARAGLLRGIGCVYAIAFAVTCAQWEPLVGSRGLLPVAENLERMVHLHDGSAWQAFRDQPGLFWLCPSDPFMNACGWTGLALALAVVAGASHAAVMAALWALYFSFVTAGQDFYAFGWETMTLEAGFLAIFLCPMRTRRLWGTRLEPSRAILWFYRWLLFRATLGSGLIKIRGDPCWRDLSCLTAYFETQPLPTALGRWLHHLPEGILAAAVAVLLAVQLLAPFLVMASPRLRRIGGAAILLMEAGVILSGNHAWSPWLLGVLCLACFDDETWRVVARRRRCLASSRPASAPWDTPSRARRVGLRLVTAVLLVASLPPAWNLVSPRQAMNRSYGALRLVNSYGSYGNIVDVRHELLIEGTMDPDAGDDAVWHPYGFKAKPGDPLRRPRRVSPFHHRLDWQLWFAALTPSPDRHPWLPVLVERLQAGDPATLRLLGHNPFPDQPPAAIRIRRATYRFARADDPGGRWWIAESPTPYWPRPEIPAAPTTPASSSGSDGSDGSA